MKYYSIQYLRFIAIASVLVIHSNTLFKNDVIQIPIFSEFGWIGVQLFFVISGFIIAERIDRYSSLSSYLFRRYFRVFPLYTIISILALFFQTMFESVNFIIYRTDSGELFSADLLGYLLKSLFIFPQDNWPLFGVGWSLEYELVFYALFGTAYFLAGRVFALSVLTVVSILGLFELLPSSHLTSPFMFYFLIGCVCSYLIKMYGNKLLLLAYPTFLLSTFIWINLLSDFEKIQSWFIVASALSFGSLIVISINLEKMKPALFSRNIISKIGDASFSLYLVHYLIFKLIKPIIHDLDINLLSLEAARFSIIGVAVFASLAVHNIIEKPLNNTIIAKLGRDKKL